MNHAQHSPLYYGAHGPPRPERGGRLPVALLFPGPRRLALSTLGWQAAYRLLAAQPGLAVERFFLEENRAADVPRSEESDTPLAEFPLICVSLNFEEEYRPLLSALLAAFVPVRRAERSGYPLVLAGGPLAWLNPAPIAPAVDAFWIGEAEAGFDTLCVELATHWLDGGSKQEFLQAVATRPGVYVPDVSPLPVRRVTADAEQRLLTDPAWSCFVSPQAEFRDMLLVEVNRGCPYGCRFCAAGYIYRPPRQARLEDLQAMVERADPPKVGLVGTALTDWPQLMPFLEWLADRGTKFSLSSVRADGLTPDFLAFLRRHGVRTITLALEAPSARLRTAANKKLAKADFLRAVELCAEHGINHLKIYLIIGWPGEADADYAELGNFLAEIDAARRRGRGKRNKGLELITLSMSMLTPKPWTPLQWAPMAAEAALSARAAQVRGLVKPFKGMKAQADAPFGARLQGWLSRAGEEAFEVCLAAAEMGGWRKAVKALKVDFDVLLDREREQNEAFPWEVVDMGVSRAFLWREWQRYTRALTTPNCPSEGCGACPDCGLMPGQ